ncbi:hypothetical protein GYA49_06110 [Candidatus Beckwithbacteria bacterium]|nr:hypothetical protein [Candidatus Beckwithbacteria bacterium]
MFIFQGNAFAALPDCRDLNYITIDKDLIISGQESELIFQIISNSLDPDDQYSITIEGHTSNPFHPSQNLNVIIHSDGDGDSAFSRQGALGITELDNGNRWVTLHNLTTGLGLCEIFYKIETDLALPDNCDITLSPSGCIDNNNTSISISSNNLVVDNQSFNGLVEIYLNNTNIVKVQAQNGSFSSTININDWTPYWINEKENEFAIKTEQGVIVQSVCSQTILKKEYCTEEDKKTTPKITGSTTNPNSTDVDPIPIKPDTCDTDSDGNDDGMETAIGCIPYELKPFIAWVFKFAIGLAGGIAFLLIGLGSFLMITSAGDPEKLKQAKEIIVSAIAGLFFIIFATYLLGIIGVDVLQIPGFS